jgi:hypothetical protein
MIIFCLDDGDSVEIVDIKVENKVAIKADITAGSDGYSHSLRGRRRRRHWQQSQSACKES